MASRPFQISAWGVNPRFQAFIFFAAHLNDFDAALQGGFKAGRKSGLDLGLGVGCWGHGSDRGFRSSL